MEPKIGFPVMLKLISITLVTCAVVIAALSLVAVGLMKWLGMEHILPVVLITTLSTLWVIDDLSRPVSIILIWMLSGNGGLTYIPISDILE